MNRTGILEIIALFIIALVGLGGGGFLWHYTGVVQAQAETNQVADILRQPKVLGAISEEIQITEKPLITDSINEAIKRVINSDSMLPTHINRLFLVLCERDASLKELDQWVNHSSQSLESYLSKAENCR